MAVVVLVLLGYMLVSAAMATVDRLKATHPELFGLACADEPYAGRRGRIRA